MFSKLHKTIDPAKKARRKLFWRKVRRFSLWSLLVAFLLHSSLNIYGSILLNRELSIIREKGDPLQFSDIEPPAVPDERNAWIVYQRATKALQFTSDEKIATRELLMSGPTSNPEEQKRLQKTELVVEKALAKNSPALALARQAAAMPECRFPLDWKGRPDQFKFGYYSDMRELARLLELQAKIDAKDGHALAALDNSQAIFRMSGHLQHEPYLIGFMVMQTIDNLGHRALAHTLDKMPLTVPQGKALLSSFPESDWTKLFRRSLVGERTMEINLFQNLISNLSPVAPETVDEYGEPMSAPWYSYPILYLVRPLLKFDQVRLLRMWHMHLDTPASQQIPQPVSFGPQQEKALAEVPRYAMLTRTLFPVFNRAGDKRDYGVVRHLEREIAIALTCYRTAKGQYPSRLSEAAKLWGTSLPKDPYSGKDFIYRRNGDSFTLYSIGVNRKDDKGKYRSFASPSKAPDDADDIVWLNASEVKRRSSFN